MLKRSLAISMAFVGTLAGAGFASGQEAMTYFVAFGNWGIVGALLGSVVMIICGIAILQLGSYYQAREHTAVIDRITNSPIIAKILDWGTIATLFSIGFVMFAGGGSNLTEAWGWPTWIGAALMLVLTILVGLLDVEKTTAVIGMITPFLIIMVLGAAIYTIITVDPNWENIQQASTEVQTTLPNWWVSAINNIAFQVIVAVSMAIVIGGSFMDTREAGIGGAIGGGIFLSLLLLLVMSMYFTVETTKDADMPMLALMISLHPVLGHIMTVVLYGMVFNTAIGMFYALAKRLTRNSPEKFFRVYVIACLVGFVLSFVGFRQLVSYVYPVLGYIGMLLIIVLIWAWVRNFRTMRTEGQRRRRGRELMARKVDPRVRFSKKHDRELTTLAAQSNMNSEEFLESIKEEIDDELENDPDVDYDRTTPAGSVVYVEHTKPE
ncbi:YkvI family membrane protein [Corynebacterium pseudodiphtheriticum]|uniref:YkvI family membrane protein n=1 Tax=Corynebacterium pseudodiphtheriticum TaxID=37637 RepID=UPI0025435CEF|nr:hypothetical protein [Corynebacterium pseudodiphtheriticum]MDK4295893.1 hypothetical protein [Corynebacterium pseudodiphtheriticum]